jgi:hypothetical protein
MANESSEKKNSELIPNRRLFPLVQKIEHLKFNLDLIKKDFEQLQSQKDWSDMKEESPLVKNLIKGRDHLTKCFANENGKYDNYHQILLTEGAPPRVESLTEKKSKIARYRDEMLKKEPSLDESQYNKPREFMTGLPYLTKVISSFSFPSATVKAYS